LSIRSNDNQLLSQEKNLAQTRGIARGQIYVELSVWCSNQAQWFVVIGPNICI